MELTDEVEYGDGETCLDTPGGIEAGALDRDWRSVTSVLPKGWEEEAVRQGAVRRQLRGFKNIETLLRVLMIHLSEGCSLRETVVRALAGGLATVSDVALLKRLRSCGPWFQWMVQQMIADREGASSCSPYLPGYRIRLVDGSIVSEPGATGSTWRIHYALNLDHLACDEVLVTDVKEGESLTRFTIHPGDLLMADRGFAHRRGIRHVMAHQGDVLLRTNLTNLPLEDRDGQALAWLPLLRTLSTGEAADWKAQMRDEEGIIPLRVCAYKKSIAQTEASQAALLREAAKKKRKVRPETLEAAAYVVVVTSLTQPDAASIMELYRRRWQVELAFKRLKSLLQLGHLKKTDPNGAKAWLQGKLFVACLIETLIDTAERFSPWGYLVCSKTAPEATLPVA